MGGLRRRWIESVADRLKCVVESKKSVIDGEKCIAQSEKDVPHPDYEHTFCGRRDTMYLWGTLFPLCATQISPSATLFNLSATFLNPSATLFGLSATILIYLRQFLISLQHSQSIGNTFNPYVTISLHFLLQLLYMWCTKLLTYSTSHDVSHVNNILYFNREDDVLSLRHKYFLYRMPAIYEPPTIWEYTCILVAGQTLKSHKYGCLYNYTDGNDTEK